MDESNINGKAPSDISTKRQSAEQGESAQQADVTEFRELCRPISQARDSSDNHQRDKKSYLGRLGKWLFGSHNTT
jgi:hypothetical protein